MKTQICKRCGETFITENKRQLYCKQIKQKSCPICGSKIEYICDLKVKETCSKKCQMILANQRKQKNLENTKRICKWCGKEFTPMHPRDRYCRNTHYKTCVVCGKEFQIQPDVDPHTNTCSKECKSKLMSQNHDFQNEHEAQKKTLMERYGVENAMQIPGMVDKIKETNVRKYGTEWYTQSEEYRRKHSNQ